MEYFSGLRVKEILPFVVIWINLYIMLSEISQVGQILHNTFHKELKIVKRIEVDNKMLYSRDWGKGVRRGISERAQTVVIRDELI